MLYVLTGMLTCTSRVSTESALLVAPAVDPLALSNSFFTFDSCSKVFPDNWICLVTHRGISTGERIQKHLFTVRWPQENPNILLHSRKSCLFMSKGICRFAIDKETLSRHLSFPLSGSRAANCQTHPPSIALEVYEWRRNKLCRQRPPDIYWKISVPHNFRSSDYADMLFLDVTGFNI